MSCVYVSYSLFLLDLGRGGVAIEKSDNVLMFILVYVYAEDVLSVSGCA